MNTMILDLLDEHLQTMNHIREMSLQIEAAANSLIKALNKGGKIFWMGNGGSAADAQHLAAELIGRFKLERKAIPSIALTTDSSILTCLSNDYDFSIVFARQLEALCQTNDVVIGISTSGNSKNVLEGIRVARQKGAFTIGLSGHRGGLLADAVDLCLTIPSANTARIQEGHIFIGHTICELVEHAMSTSTVTTTADSILV